MNQFTGKIASIDAQGALRLYRVDLGYEIVFSAIVIQGNDKLEALQIGHTLSVVFKETEVVIATGQPEISLQNRILGTISRLDKGEVLSKLTLNTLIGELEAIITSNAVAQLNLELGNEVIALVKTNEVMLAP